MEQTVTQEQWEELSYDGKSALIACLYPTTIHEVPPTTKTVIELYLDEYFKDYGINIGQIIEFLGEDWGYLQRGWHHRREVVQVGANNQVYLNEELCDALWEACKQKLNQT